MKKIKGEYLLAPKDGRKSFYNKAKVTIYSNGAEVLRSYDTDVAVRDASGNIHRIWDDWSATTGRHIYAFCGMRKAEWMKLPVEHDIIAGLVS